MMQMYCLLLFLAIVEFEKENSEITLDDPNLNGSYPSLDSVIK